MHFISGIEEFRRNGRDQNQGEFTSANKIKIEEMYVNWELDALRVWNAYKAFKGSSFGTIRTLFEGKTVFLEEVRIAEKEEEAILKGNHESRGCGGVVWMEGKLKKNLYVKCATGWIVIKMWRFGDKQMVNGLSFAEKFMKEKGKEIKFENFTITRL